MKKNVKQDLKDRLASLMIYIELKEGSNSHTFISHEEMTKRLEERYGKENVPSHNTIAKYLKAMKEYSDDLGIDVRRGNSRQGYNLVEREFSEWEIELFVDAVLSSKTLSTIDKKNIIDKLYAHLGPISDEKIDRIYDYLFPTKTNKKTNDNLLNKDTEETFENLYEAIKKDRQVETIIYSNYVGSKNLNTIRYKRTIHPYRIFERNNSAYLIYGQVLFGRQFVLYEKIENIKILSIKKDGILPIENVKGFENGIDEKKLRKDPFGYLTKTNEENIIAQVIIKDENVLNIVKKEVELKFGNSASFYHDKNKLYLYINDDYEKCLYWFLLHSGEYKILSPEPFVQLMKVHTANMYKTYGDNDMSLKEYEDEYKLLRSMYRNNRDFLRTKTGNR